jgi:predicted permease
MILWLAQTARDFRHAVRVLRRMPGLAAVVVLSLGVGIGVNTAVFSWIQALVLQPIPGVRDASRFQLVEARAANGSYPGMSWPEYLDVQSHVASFRDLAAFRLVPFNVGEPARLERAFGQLVSGNYFAALGLRPAIGRLVGPDDARRPGGEPVVVVSHQFWQTRLGGTSEAIGRPLRVNDRVLTIVGVAPPGFYGTVVGMNFDLWVPATLAPALFAGSRELEIRSSRGYAAIGTLATDATRSHAQTDLTAAMQQLARDYPETNGNITGEVLPFWKAPRGPQQFLVAALAALQVVMLLLLLAVCGNTANLVLARASVRHRETGVRLALGAGRWRIVNLLLAETLLLGLIGGGIGAALAVWGTDAMRAVRFSTALPIEFHTRVDAGGLAFAVLLGVASGVIVGLIPAIQLSRIDPQRALRAAGSTPPRSRLRAVLMGVQVALALLVLIVAGVSLKSLQDARRADPGFRREGLLLAAYDLSGRSLPAGGSRDLADRLLTRLRTLPAVDAAAIASSVPLDIHGLGLRTFTLEGRARADGRAEEAFSNTVTRGYFSAMGIALRAGSDFAGFDDPAAAPQAMVNEEFVWRFVGDGAAIGRHVDAGGRQYAIVGIVADSRYDSFTEPPAPIVYFSYRDRPVATGEIHLYTRAGGETALVPDLRRIVREIDPSLPLYNVRTMSDHLETNLVFRRIPARMFVVLGPLLLVLAGIGIVAVVAFEMSQRTVEIGVRLALGATAARLVRHFVSQTLGVIGVGALAGWLIAFVVALDVIPDGSIDVRVFAAVPILLLSVAAFACWLPVHRATHGDPMIALRNE